MHGLLYAVVLSSTQTEAARRIADSSRVCRSDHSCLRGVDCSTAIRIVSRVIHDIKSLFNSHEKTDKTQYIMASVIRSFKGYSEKGYAIMDWTIGTPPYVKSNCCRWCFMHCYGIGNTTLTKLCQLIKQDKQELRSFNDHCRPYVYQEVFKNALDDAAHRIGINLNHRQVAAMQIPNTPKVNNLFPINCMFLLVYIDIIKYVYIYNAMYSIMIVICILLL